jgi:3-deoxy-manno-octulosonate cytidylyltransferase (CMP-KDO synthetase)
MNTPAYTVVIPARLGSTRLPRKPLQQLAGLPLVVHVVRRALEAGAAEVIVATDAEAIAQAVAGSGADVELTAAHHPSGTDRIAEVAARRGWDDERIVVNLQGDEPLAPPSGINAAAQTLAHGAAPMATLATAIDDIDELWSPSVVKVVTDRHGRALYFSRAPLPWAREAFAQGRPTHLPDGLPFLRHIGIYAYRAGFLRAFAALPPGRLETVEALEQLRVLEAGHAIAVGIAPEPFPAGIDTPDDLARVEALLAAGSRR